MIAMGLRGVGRASVAGLTWAACAWLGPASAQTPPAPPVISAPIASSTYPRAREVQVRATAIVRVIPEHRAGITISVRNPGSLRTPAVRLAGRRLMIDGGLGGTIRACRSGHGAVRVGDDWIARDRLPVIEIRTPRRVELSAAGAAYLSIGPSDSLQLAFESCGVAHVEEVAGAAEISLAGGGDLRLATAESVDLRLAGAGDVTIGAVRDGLDLAVAGAGDVVIGHAGGPLNAAIQGAGDVVIRDGRTTLASVVIAGAGDLVHRGRVETLDAAVFGAGDVVVREVEGRVSKRVFGAGEIAIGP